MSKLTILKSQKYQKRMLNRSNFVLMESDGEIGKIIFG